MSQKKGQSGGAGDFGPTADPGSHEDFLVLFKRGLKFTEELLAENERLRFKVATLESESDSRRGRSDRDELREVDQLRRRVDALEAEKARLLSSFEEAATLNRDFQTRYAEIEEEHNNLANLYIASYQLHSSLAFREVVQVVHEIVINLVGVAQFTMYLHDAPSGVLYAIAGEAIDVASTAGIRVGDGPIGAAARERKRVMAERASAHTGGVPIAIVPLSTVEQLVGVIVIDKLLSQKEGFGPVDVELFNLLGVHAATALLSALLRGQLGDEGANAALSIDHARRLLA